MKKIFYLLVLTNIILIYFFSVSCNKTPTYEEMKTAERKIIRTILTEKNIEVLDEYPKNGLFGENQFVLLNSGIYLNVVDSGNGNRAVFEGNRSTDVLIRSKGMYYVNDSVIAFNYFSNSYPPMEFKYGSAYNVVEDHKYTEDIYYLCFGMGLESILTFVGDSAVVKLLVPGYSEIKSGNNSFSASSTFQNSGLQYTFIPIFFDMVRFTFYE